MLNSLLGSKLTMTQSFVEGARTPVTKIALGPCIVTHIKKEDKDGYWAVQIGYGERKQKLTTKTMQRHFKKSHTSEDNKNKTFPRYVREVRVTEEPKEKIGEQLKASDIFVCGDIISVTGTSKGKGFAGAVKRWHFAGGPKTHGQSDRQRAPGSIGQGTTPGRVLKGKHMAGRMGSDTVTVKNLKQVIENDNKNKIKVNGPALIPPEALFMFKRLNERSAEGEVKTNA